MVAQDDPGAGRQSGRSAPLALVRTADPAPGRRRRPHRVDDGGRAVPLVEVGATEGEEEREPAQPGRAEPAGVPRRHRREEPGQLVDPELGDGLAQGVGRAGPAGAEHDDRVVPLDAGAGREGARRARSRVVRIRSHAITLVAPGTPGPGGPLMAGSFSERWWNGYRERTPCPQGAGAGVVMTRELALGLGLAVGGAAYFAMSWYVWRHRVAAGGSSLVVALLGIFVWTACYAVELSTQTVAAAQTWSGLKFVGVVTVPPALWAFVRQYTTRRPLPRWMLALLCVEPVVVLTLLALPATRDLVHYYVPADALDDPPVAHPGPLLWPHATYSWVLLLVALGTFVARVGRIGGPYRRQANVVIVASLLPLLGNVVYNLDLFGLGRVDPAPFLFVIFTFVLVWGIFRLRLLDIVPVARGALVAQMLDGVLVLDAQGRIADVNAAAADVVGARPAALVGRYVEEVLPGVVPLLQEHVPDATSTAVLVIDRAGQSRDYAVHVSPLADRAGSAIARLVVLRDVTERLDAERRLRDLLDDRTRLAETLQAGLRPQLLPAVPGVRIAARWVPAGGAGGRVSGDFYDVHQTLGGDHAFVLGDVAGKGVHAAVVTSMARYTLRTLSAQGWSPGRSLEQLNQALLDDLGEERFCTVLYGRIMQDPVDVATDWTPGVRITLALGGHPQPLVRWLDGSVTAVGQPGTALGLLSQVEIKEESLQLQPGEVLVAYTDGVTEGRRGVEQFGEQRLADVVAAAAEGLRGTRGAAAAALVADSVADGILDAVEAYSSERDDVAVLVVVAE